MPHKTYTFKDAEGKIRGSIRLTDGEFVKMLALDIPLVISEVESPLKLRTKIRTLIERRGIVPGTVGIVRSHYTSLKGKGTSYCVEFTKDPEYRTIITACFKRGEFEVIQ